MLSKLTRFASPKVQKLLTQIETSESDFVPNNRQHEREKISLPILVSALDGEDHEIAFSRDLSEKGMCLISPTTFKKEDVSKLSIDFGDADGRLKELTGTCRWCLPFGKCYSLSGWQIEGSLDVDKIAERVASGHEKNRYNDRIQTVIPVVVHQKKELAPLQAFTRNLSAEGVCLVCLWPTTPGEFCLLDLASNDGQTDEVVAECVWTRPFGNCFMSGWKFPRLDRIQKFHRSYWDTNSGS